jgi:adenosylcobinamide-GDP ribazoletransferase
MVALAAASQPAGEGLGSAFCASLSRAQVAAAVALGCGFALTAGWRAAALVAAANVAAVAALRAYFHRRIGGVTGDCIGATAVLSEALSLLVLTCRMST